MPDYRRAWQTGGTYFSAVNLLQRRSNDLLIREIELLRRVVASVSARHPFTIHAWVVLPAHLNYLLEFPQSNSDFALR